MTPRKYGLLIVLVAVIVFAHGRGYLKPIEWGIGKAVGSAARPFTAIARAFSGARHQEAVPEEIRATLEAQTVEIIRLKEELGELELLHGYAAQANYATVLARIVGKPADGSRSFLVIDRGETHGIRERLPVISGEGVLVGTIAKVTPATAIVRLLTHPESKIAATTLDAARTLGVVQGEQGLALSLTLVPRGETLAPGMRVVSSGLGQGIPRGLLIGTLREVYDIPSEAFLSASITPPRTYDLLPLVGVLVSPL